MLTLNLLREFLPVMRVQAAAQPVDPDHQREMHPVRQYIDAIKRGLKRPFPIAPGVTMTYRAVAGLKGKVGEYSVKFTFQHNHDEIQDLDLVMFVGLDDMIGLFQARKIRAVSKEHQYRHTAKDEAAVLSTDPATVCEDIRNKLGPRGELNKVVMDLYHQAVRHLGARHPENAVPAQKLSPFDYGMEFKRAFGKTPVHVDAHATLVLESVTALKADDDVVVKFKPTLKDLPDTVTDLEFLFYLTTDKLTDGVGARKIRFRSKKMDYTDSDAEFWMSFDNDPETAAKDLRHELENGPLGDTVREMAMRAVYQLSGGDNSEHGWRDSDNPGHFADPGDEEETDKDSKPGSGIDWNELGLEDPGL